MFIERKQTDSACNVTSRPLRATIVSVEKQLVLQILSVFL